jgi:hypothetical protein
MASSFASRRGPSVALDRSLFRLSMCYDADRRRGSLVFRSENTRQELSSPTQSLWGADVTASTAAAAADALGRVAGIKKAVYRSSERRVRGEDDKIPPIKTVAADLPLDVLRNMDIRVDPWSAPTFAPPNALRIRPAHARTSGAHVSRSDVLSYEGLGPRHRVATRSHMQHRLLHLRVRRVRGQRQDRQVLGRVAPLAAAPSHQVGPKSTQKYLFSDPRDRAHRVLHPHVVCAMRAFAAGRTSWARAV